MKKCGPDAKPEKMVQNIKNMRFLYEQIVHLDMLPCPYHRYYYMTDAIIEEELQEAQVKVQEGRS